MMDVRSLPGRRPQRRGLLPLKKRISSTYSPRVVLDPHPPEEEADKILPGSDETMAALALIQASGSGSPSRPRIFQGILDPSTLPLLPTMMRMEQDVPLSLLSLHSRPFVHAVPTTVSNDLDLASNHSSELSAFTTEQESMMETDAMNHKSSTYCRGRTSRTNAVCRRQCTKGQRYCKIHIQQQQLAGSATADDDAASQQHRQDKRFTGRPHEVCCRATTTRGRPCAYVAVNASGVCFLHSDFKSSQQGGRPTEAAAARTLRATDSSRLELTSSKKKRLTAASAGEESSSKLPSPLVDVPVSKKPRGRRASKLAEKHAESPYFLLSMISSDQWEGKKVSILLGPMKGREGTVEKWSNGWVSVRIPGTGLHNRRSVELAVVKVDDDGLLEERAREASSPLPTTDHSVAGSCPLYYGDASTVETGVIETPRAAAVSGPYYTDCLTPIEQTFNAAASTSTVTPGSTSSAFRAMEHGLMKNKAATDRRQGAADHPYEYKPTSLTKLQGKKRLVSETERLTANQRARAT
jgi:hypothetical protein